MSDSTLKIVQLFSPATDTTVLRRDQLLERVANRLRQEIFTGRRSPGARLVETRVAAELGVAQSSAREALHQTPDKEGLITRIPNVGACVTSLTPLQVEQIYLLRVLLESYAVQLVGEQGEPEDIQSLEARISNYLRAVDDSPLEFDDGRPGVPRRVVGAHRR